MLQRLLRHSSVYEASRRLIGATREMERLVGEFVRPAPGMTLLDIGCGNGRLVPFLPEVAYVGVDHNQSYIDDAQSRYAGPTVRFIGGDLGEFPADSIGPFDVAVSIGVLHHLDDTTAQRAIADTRERLKPGGRLITMDPCFEPGQRQIARVLMALDRGKFVRHPTDYQRLLDDGTVDVEAVVLHDVYAFPYTHLVTQSIVR